jgi:post-segregation antitoxin (ccd killing protein)
MRIHAHIMRMKGNAMNTLAMTLPSTRTRKHSTQRPTKRPVNLTLSDEVVRQARALTPNLSAVVETLLAGYVQQHGQTLAAKRKEIEEVTAGWNAFHDQHGSFADEYCTL